MKAGQELREMVLQRNKAQSSQSSPALPVRSVESGQSVRLSPQVYAQNMRLILLHVFVGVITCKVSTATINYAII